MKRNLTVLACTFIVICAFTILPPLSSDSGFPFLYGAKASSEDIIPPLPSIDEIHERFNMRNSIIFPLSEIKHGSGNYFGCNVVLNGVFSGSLSYQTYDNFSMQGFSLEIHYIHDSAAAEKKAWVTSQSQNNALDFTHELSKSIWFFTEVLRATWPDMSEEEAHEIILGSMQALVDQGFESLNFDYLKGLQKNGSLGPSGIYPTYKGYEFYFSSGVNWIGLKLRRPSLKPAIENNSVTIDQLASSYFLTLQSDVYFPEIKSLSISFAEFVSRIQLLEDNKLLSTSCDQEAIMITDEDGIDRDVIFYNSLFNFDCSLLSNSTN